MTEELELAYAITVHKSQERISGSYHSSFAGPEASL